MKFKTKPFSFRVGGLVGAGIVLAIGFVLLAFDSRLSRTLTRASYDWSFDLSRFARPDLSGSDVVIVYIDEDSFKELKQSLLVPMKRSIHAKLLDLLKQDGAKAVVMDVLFTDPDVNDAKSDEMFAEAIRANGRVILAADYNERETYRVSQGSGGTTSDQTSPGIASYGTFSTPYPPLEAAAARVGLDPLWPDDDFTVRRHFHGFANVPGSPPSLSWATARLLDLKVTRNPSRQWTERWVYYYGPPETIPHVSYKKVFSPGGVSPGFFRDKIVFIGARPIAGQFIERRDELRSPYSVRGDRAFVFMPMVEIHATQFLNLLRGDWLTRPSPGIEIAILAAAALIFGFGLLSFRPWAATGLAVAGALAVMVAAQSLFAARHVWFPWLIVVAAQIPSALLYSIIFRSLEWYAQRRQLEEERRRADRRIREQAALLDKAQDAIIVHDLNWRAEYWNQSAERLYGWSFEEVKAKDLKAEVFKTDEAKMLDALQATLLHGEWTGELTQSSKDGKALKIQSRWTLVRDEEGRPKSILVINTDVTENKKLEAQFLRTQRMESIGTLAGGIAHDLNNVLSPIIMGVELLRMNHSDEYTMKMLATMASSAKRGSDMVKQVLTFARGHEGDRTVLQISHLIREMQKIVRETFPKSIEFKVLIGENLSTILGDATQMHQIILNLCVNARDAMPEGGKIVVEAENVALSEAEVKKNIDAKPINYVLLSVTDTGTGIPPEIIDKIFEPFFTTKEIGKGTGLGLSTVISIIKSHGGFLDLKSEVGKGTSFNVYLPAAEAPAAVATAPLPPESLRGRGETVMLVDDEPAVLELTGHILTHHGYKVVTASNGADALALYPQYHGNIKVVIVDMMMPVMDGPTAIRALRKLEPNLKFLAISGLMQSDVMKDKLAGIKVSFLAKPFSAEKLLQNLRELLEEHTNDSEPNGSINKKAAAQKIAQQLIPPPGPSQTKALSSLNT